jgi:hypothetical protein
MQDKIVSTIKEGVEFGASQAPLIGGVVAFTGTVRGKQKAAENAKQIGQLQSDVAKLEGALYGDKPTWRVSTPDNEVFGPLRADQIAEHLQSGSLVGRSRIELSEGWADIETVFDMGRQYHWLKLIENELAKAEEILKPPEHTLGLREALPENIDLISVDWTNRKMAFEVDQEYHRLNLLDESVQAKAEESLKSPDPDPIVDTTYSAYRIRTMDTGE